MLELAVTSNRVSDAARIDQWSHRLKRTSSSSDDGHLVGVVDPNADLAVKEDMDVGMLQAEEVANTQLSPGEVGFGEVVIQVEKHRNLLPFGVLQCIQMFIQELKPVLSNIAFSSTILLFFMDKQF